MKFHFKTPSDRAPHINCYQKVTLQNTRNTVIISKVKKSHLKIPLTYFSVSFNIVDHTSYRSRGHCLNERKFCKNSNLELNAIGLARHHAAECAGVTGRLPLETLHFTLSVVFFFRVPFGTVNAEIYVLCLRFGRVAMWVYSADRTMLYLLEGQLHTQYSAS